MRWQQAEFIFKGIYLGMLLFVGLVLGDGGSWRDLAQVGICTVCTLALFVGVTAVRKLGEGYRVHGRLGPFVLFLVLESPGMVYAGVLLGMLLGAYGLADGYSMFGAEAERTEGTDLDVLSYCCLGGAALGVLFIVLHHVQVLKVRRWLGVALGAGLIVAGIVLLPEIMPSKHARNMFAALLLLGIPLFYLLTLASLVEESEVEIMAMCAALGVSIWTLTESTVGTNVWLQLALLLAPAATYYWYTRYVLPDLRVFKHVLRGVSYANVGHMGPALLSLGRALHLNPANSVAREQLWNVHRMMDFKEVVKDPGTLGLLNFELCLGRVATLLLATKPTAEHLPEARRLLELVASQRPDMMPRCDYWTAVALTHERQFDEAAATLTRVLDGQATEPGNPHRQVILFAAWQLALMLHGEMTRRVGKPRLAIAGQRMQAIAAVENLLAKLPEDAAAWDLKRVLYDELTEAEYLTQVVDDKPPTAFDHGYVLQLGLALLDDAQRWQRSCELLRIAAVGLPAQAPVVYLKIAKAQEKAGNFAEVWRAYEAVKKAGQKVGPKELDTPNRQTYFAVVKLLGEDAAKRGDNAAAIENYRLFTEYDRAGIQTYRTLADLYERQGNVWAALYATEHGLVYDAKDPDLLRAKTGTTIR